MSGRAERVAGAVRQELTNLIARELKDPRLASAGLVTVTEVRVTPDLRYCDVNVAFAQGAKDALAALERAAGFLRGEIGRRLDLKRTPELRFHQDKTAEYAARIDAALKGEGE